MRSLFMISAALLCSCGSPEPRISDSGPIAGQTLEFVDLSKREKPAAITQNPWQEVVINVTDFSHATDFFVGLGGFEVKESNSEMMLLTAPGADGGFIRLVLLSDGALPARPPTSRAWDKGCYFSLMMRAINLQTIIDDAAKIGWTPLTDMAFLKFGPSQLHIVVLTHESGLRVQLYERLTTPVPEAFPPFERLSRPFNVMQMVEDRDISYDFFQQKLGFDTFYFGPPYVSKTEEVMPLGIPKNLTTKIPYKTGIVTPKAGLEWGRIEMIDIENMPNGKNYAESCTYDRTGIIAVRFETSDLNGVKQTLTDRGVAYSPRQNGIVIKTPDGSNIEFAPQ